MFIIINLKMKFLFALLSIVSIAFACDGTKLHAKIYDDGTCTKFNPQTTAALKGKNIMGTGFHGNCQNKGPNAGVKWYCDATKVGIKGWTNNKCTGPPAMDQLFVKYGACKKLGPNMSATFTYTG